MAAEAAAVKSGHRKPPTPSKLAEVRSSSKRLLRKFARMEEEDDEEAEEEQENLQSNDQSFSPIKSGRKRRPVSVLSDDGKEDDEVEVPNTNAPTLNLNQRSTTTTTTGSTYSAGVMSTYPDEEENMEAEDEDEEAEDEDEEAEEDEEADEDEEIEADDDELDSLEDYIDDSIEDGEGEFTQPLGHSTIISSRQSIMNTTSITSVKEEISSVVDEVAENPKETSPPSRPPLLMLSGFPDDDRERLIAILESRLGVAVHRDHTVLQSVTHLILKEPTATEKTLSAIAAGVWILTPEYVERSVKAGRLLPEAAFDWSSQDLSTYSHSSSRRRLMLASAVWRQYIGDRHHLGGGVFSGWRTLLVNRLEQMESMAKILGAGGAEVLRLEEQFGNNGKRVSSQAFEKRLAELLATVRYAIFDQQRMTGKASAAVVGPSTHPGTVPSNALLTPYPKELISRAQFGRLLEAFAAKGRLIRQEALSRYLINAKPEEDEEAEAAELIGKFAVSASDIREMVKGLK